MTKHLFPLMGLAVLVNLALSVSALAVDRINITEPPYGATPNDGTNDTAAINAAVAAGRSIYFPPGTYNYSGRITLPANQAYRLYGDGPGVSTIIFTGPNAGIYGPSMQQKNLNVEGLTLRANTTACGVGIEAYFGGGKFRSATILNVQIGGSTRDGTLGGYWTGGIYLHRAENAVIDGLEISGNKNVTQFGLRWESPSDQVTTGLNASNLQIKWCNSAFRTAGHVEGIYMTGFEFFSCGRAGLYAVDLAGSIGPAPNYLKPATSQFVNGLIDSVGSGMATTLPFTKVSNVRFTHTGPEVADSTMLYINGTNGAFDMMVTECSFYGVSPGQVANENGIFVYNAHSVRLAGNHFSHMQPGNGSCIVIIGNSSVVRVTDNLFNDVRSPYYNAVGDTYFNGNNR
jgi:hypothetical protein